MCPGDQELAYPGFEKLALKYKIPLLASNISMCDDNSCHSISPEEMIVKRAGARILLISCVHPDVFALYPEKVTRHINVLPLNETIKGIINLNKGYYDIVILISHSGYDADKEIAAAIPGISLIIGGHSQTTLAEPAKVGNTLIVQCGQNTQNAGKIVLKFGKDHNIKSSEYNIIPLTKDISDDPRIRELITEYNAAASSAGKKESSKKDIKP